MTSDREYVVLARDLDPAVSEQIRTETTGDNPALAGAAARARAGPRVPAARRRAGHDARRPPARASSTATGQGQYGVEQFYQDQLAGMPRVVAAQKDAAGNPVPDSSTVLDAGLPGPGPDADHRRRRSRSRSSRSCWPRGSPTAPSASRPWSWTRTAARSCAYASYPSYDANDYQAIAAATPERFIDPIVSTVYEPGSVFKMLTATAALGRGTVTPRTRLTRHRQALGRRRPGPRRRRRPPGAWAGWRSEDAIAYSRNVVAAKVALELGTEHPRVVARSLYETWRRMGFGSATGIDVANEVPGIVRDPAVDAVAARSTSPTARSARGSR